MSGLDDFYLKCRGAQITRSEREFLKAMAEQTAQVFDKPLFVNIGVAWGATMHCLRAGCSEARLIGVDINYDKRILQEPDLLNAECLKGDSGIVCNWVSVSKESVHLLFVDGCHHYGTVKADIEGWTPKIPPGGVVIFHDYNPSEDNLKRYPELDSVRYAVDEWRSDGWRRGWDAPDSLTYFIRNM